MVVWDGVAVGFPWCPPTFPLPPRQNMVLSLSIRSPTLSSPLRSTDDATSTGDQGLFLRILLLLHVFQHLQGSPICNHCDHGIHAPWTEYGYCYIWTSIAAVGTRLSNHWLYFYITPISNLAPLQGDPALLWPPQHLHVCHWYPPWWGDFQHHSTLITILS